MQPDEHRLVGSIIPDADLWHTDQMGNIYLARGNSILKYDSGLSPVAEYSSPHLGDVFSVDVSDPLRILVYYKDHNQLVWLDNYLNEIRSPLRLDQLGIDQAEQVCASSQGGFWVYDGLNALLTYYDARLQAMHQSMDLHLLAGPDIRPFHLVEKNQQVYMGVQEKGIMVFDRFGNYSRSLPEEVTDFFQVTDQHLYYFAGGELTGYDLRDGNLQQILLPELDEIVHAELQPGRLYILTDRALQVYNIPR
jgi:hypothetical protein